MGAGKTTLGNALARHASCGGSFLPPDCVYVDLDDYIENREGMSVRAIFESRGEDAFRSLESAALRELGGRGNIIVGCGGGTPCHGGNMEWMNSHGLTVLLEAPRHVLLRRLLDAQAQRPLLDGMDAGALERFIDMKLRERESAYGLAAVRFPSGRLESEDEIAGTVRAFGEMLQHEGYVDF